MLMRADEGSCFGAVLWWDRKDEWKMTTGEETTSTHTAEDGVDRTEKHDLKDPDPLSLSPEQRSLEKVIRHITACSHLRFLPIPSHNGPRRPKIRLGEACQLVGRVLVDGWQYVKEGTSMVAWSGE